MDTTLSLGDAADTANKKGRADAWALTLVFHPARADECTRAIVPAGVTALGRASELFGAGALDEAGISRDHALVELNSLDELSIADSDSRNGTFINGKRATKARLRVGDVVSIGRAMVLVERAPAHDGAPRGSHAYALVLATVAKAAATDATVLLRGETGAGKDYIARAIHAASGASGPLVAVRCGALSESTLAAELFGRSAGELGADDPGRPGLLESADGGTVYLDGVDDASGALQVSLLEFLDCAHVRRVGSQHTTKVQARVVASTRSTPEQWAASTELRPDFRQRLERIVIDVPPLRARRADILVLAAGFVRQFAGCERPLHRKLRLALLRHEVPGNVRQLAALMEALVVDQDDDGPLHLTEAAEDRLRSGNPLTSQETHVSAVTSRLVVATTGHWCKFGGQTTDLSRRRTLRLVVAALAERRRSSPGSALSLDELLAAGWPDETVLAEAGRNRVHVALTTLRKLGLRDVIIREDDGYLFDPSIDIDLQ